MNQLNFIQNPILDLTQQLSTQLADQLSPLHLSDQDSMEQRKKLISFYLLWANMIISQGIHEHTGDWDPALSVTMRNDETIGNEPGFHVAEILGDNLLLEHPNEDGESPNEDEDCYYRIPIYNIRTISLNFH